MLGAICAAYLTSRKSMKAVVSACIVFGICGQLSENDGKNGTFLLSVIDKLSTIDENEIAQYLDIEEF